MEIDAALGTDRLAFTTVWPFNYTGRRQQECYLVAKIVAHFRRRESMIELGKVDVSCDFGDVCSVAVAYLGLIEGRRRGTFDICTGMVHSLADVVGVCVEITNHLIDVRLNQAFVRANDIALLAGDPSRLVAAVPGWCGPPLRDNLAWMLAA